METHLSVFKSRKIVGMVYNFLGDQEPTISYLSANLNKDEILVEGGEENINLSEIKIPPSSKINLGIVGSEVLIKKLPLPKTKDISVNINLAFPFLKEKEFLIQTYYTSSAVFVAALKVETLHEILTRLSQRKIHPISIVLGPFTFPQLDHVLSSQMSCWRISGYRVDYGNREILDIENIANGSRENCGIIEVEKVSTDLVYNFSLILNSITPKVVLENSNDQLVAESKRSFYHKIFNYYFSFFAIVFLILLLSTSLMFYINYNEKNTHLKDQYTLAVGIGNKLKILKGQYENKIGTLDSMSLSNQSQIAFYADRLASVLPKEIRITEMLIYPLEKSKSDKTVSFETDVIRIKGVCNDHLVLETWIKDFSRFDWIKGFDNKRYWYNDDKQLGEFELSIQLID